MYPAPLQEREPKCYIFPYLMEIRYRDRKFALSNPDHLCSLCSLCLTIKLKANYLFCRSAILQCCSYLHQCIFVLVGFSGGTESTETCNYTRGLQRRTGSEMGVHNGCLWDQKQEKLTTPRSR